MPHKNTKKPQDVTPHEKEYYLKERKTLPESKFNMVDSKEEVKAPKSAQKTSGNNFARNLDGDLVLEKGIMLARFADAIENCELKLIKNRDNDLFWISKGIVITDSDVQKALVKQKKGVVSYYINCAKEKEIAFVATAVTPLNVWKHVNEKKQEEVQVDPMVDLLAQIQLIQKQLAEVLDQNKMLMAQNQLKDEMIAKLVDQIDSMKQSTKVEDVLQLRNDEVLPQEESTPAVDLAAVIEKFTDDGVKAQLSLSDNPTPQEAMEVLKNKINLSPEQQAKVVNEAKRDVTAEKVEEPYAKRLAQDLKPSEQTFSQQKKVSKPQRTQSLHEFKPRTKLGFKRDPNCPKGILSGRWNSIKQGTPEEVEKKTILEYLRIFRTDFFILQKRWLSMFPKKRNPYLISYKLVWETIGKNKVDVLWKAISAWKEDTIAFKLSKVTMTESQSIWYKNQAQV